MMSLPWIINCTCTISPTKSILIRLEVLSRHESSWWHFYILLVSYVSLSILIYVCNQGFHHFCVVLKAICITRLGPLLRNCCLIEELSCPANNKKNGCIFKGKILHLSISISGWTDTITVLVFFADFSESIPLLEIWAFSYRHAECTYTKHWPGWVACLLRCRPN